MWEITLIGEDRDFLYFSQLRDYIVKLNIKAYISIGTNDNLYISIAATEDISNKVSEYILETIIKVNKRDYLIENLDFLGSDSVYDEFILTSIIYMDLSQEIDFARYSASLGKTINIRSFFRFKLARLMIVWARMCDEINSSIEKSKKETIYLDFLKYLADVNEPTYDVIYLDKKEQNIHLFDKKNNGIKAIPSNDEIEVIVNLIIFAPKKIVIRSQDTISDKSCNMLRYIFNDRLSLVL